MLPIISISGGTLVEGNSGFPSLQFTVTLSQASASTVRINFGVENGTAFGEGVDFNDNFNSLTFNPGETTKVINVQVRSDTLDEADESVIMHLYDPTQADFAGGLTSISAMGFILDDDGTGGNLGLFVSDARIIEGDSGTKQAVFEVWLSRPATSQLTFAYTTVDGSAVAGEDYIANAGSVVFQSGQQMRTVTVDLIGDTIPELSEIFSLAVTPTGAIANGAQGAVGEALIFDDDAFGGNLPTISITRGEVFETSNGFPDAVFIVSLSQASPNPVTVNYRTVSDTAGGENGDFTTEFRTVTFQPGQTTAFIGIQVNSTDVLDEADERFYVELYNPTQAVFGGDQNTVRASVFILDDDGLGNNLGLFVSDPTIIESDSGQKQAVFEIELSRPSDTQLSFNFTTADGSAVAGQDYTAKSGIVTFAPGQTFASVIVNVNGDTSAEFTETFSLALTPTGAIGNGGQGAAGTATILDDDTGGGVLPTLSISGGAINETSNSFPTIDYTVTLSEPSSNTVRVDYRTIGGTAGAEGDDFDTRSGTITFQPGQTTAVISVQVRGSNDLLDETDENVIVELSSPTQAVLAGGQPVLRTTGYILDDDGAGPNIGLFVSDPVVLEGTGGQSFAVFEITLSQPADTSLTFNYQTRDGTAVAGTDYAARSGTITFLAGQQTTSVIVPVFSDGASERAELFSLAVTPTSAIANGATAAVGEATVLDDDSSGGVLPVISVLRGEVVESANGFPDVWMTVVLSQPSTNIVQVNYTTSSGSAIEGTDFSDRTGTLTFQPGETALSVLVTAIGSDNFGLESDEFFFFDVTNPQGATLEGGGVSLREVGIILDDDGFDDNTVLIVSDTVEAESQAADGGFVEVHLSRPSQTAITFNYTTQNASAVSGSDFAGGSGSFTFLPGQTTARIPVAVFDDGFAEGTERFIINIAANSAVANGASGFSINVDLLDGDDAASNLDDDIILGGSLIAERLNNNGLNKVTPGAAAANDVIFGEGGADLVAGGNGADLLSGGIGNDTLNGEVGNDTLVGDADDDILRGGDGDDQLFAGLGKDRAEGGLGNDLLQTSNGNDTLLGGDGNDILGAGAGGDLVRGDAGLDQLFGSNGNDRMFGGDNNDTLIGGNGRDTLDGGTGADRIDGGAQVDTAAYDAAAAGVAASLTTGLGTAGEALGDTLIAIENLKGSAFNDSLDGSVSANRLDGGLGADVLQGFAGADILVGGAGRDTMAGGADNDQFWFFAGDGADAIADFQAGAAFGDIIRIFGRGLAIDTFAEVMARSSQVGADVVINFGGGDTITLQNVTLASLDAGDFLFG